MDAARLDAMIAAAAFRANEDPMDEAALVRAVELSAEAEVDIRASGHNLSKEFLVRARDGMRLALLELSNPDISIEQVREAQNKIHRFQTIIGWVREVVLEGFDAAKVLHDRDQQQIEELAGLSEENREAFRKQGIHVPDGDA